MTYSQGLAYIIAMVHNDESAEDIAAAIAAMPPSPGASISRTIESLAYPGTLAEAVFDILAGDM